MKKLLKVASVAMAAVMMLSSVPMTSASAASKKAVSSANVEKGIKLSWKKTKKSKKYTVYRSTKKSKGYKSIGKTKKLTFTDKKAKAGKTYYYKVKASTGYTYKLEKAVRLNAPKLKTATVSGEKVKLTWSKVKGAKSYCIYSYYSGWGYMYVGETKKTSYSDDMEYQTSGTYKYRVTAENGSSESAYSNIKKVKYTAPLEAPMGLAFMNQDRTGMKVVFSQKSDAQGYKIYRSTDNGKNFTLLKDIKKADVQKADGIFAKLEKFADSLISFIAKEMGGVSQSEIKEAVDEIGLKFAQYVDTDVTYGTKYTYAIQYYTTKRTSERQTIGANIEYKEADLEMTVGEESDFLYNQKFELTDEMKAQLKEYDIDPADIDVDMINSLLEMCSDLFDVKNEVEDTEILTVDEKGNIKALKAGKTTITQTISLDLEGFVISFSGKIVVKVNEGVTDPTETPSESTPESSETPSDPAQNPSETPSESTPDASRNPSDSTPDVSQNPSEPESQTPSESTTKYTEPSETVKGDV